jgi:hypothetical protein
VHRALKIASLTPEAKKVATEVGLDGNKSALLAAKDKSGDAAKEVANLRAERARRDAGKQHKDAGRAKRPYVERWVPQSNSLIETMVLWPIKSAQHHLEDAMRGLKEFKPKMSEAEMYAVCNAFMDVCELAYSGADVVKLKEESSK